MGQTIFDIFSGSEDNDARWIEVVEGLSNARQRIEELAADSPGRYFVFDSKTYSVVAQIDSRSVLTWPKSKVKSA